MTARFIEGDICFRNPVHGRKRYMSTGRCVECAKEAAKWHQKKNRENHRERQRRYEENNPDLVKAVRYSTALKLLCKEGSPTDAVSFVSELFGWEINKVIQDMEQLIRRTQNLNTNHA